MQILHTSKRYPLCNTYNRSRAEMAFVSVAVETLLDYYEPAEIHLEYRLSPSCRVDIACLRDGAPAALFECKAYQIRPADIKQAQRYLDAAADHWPGRKSTVWLLGPSLSPRLPDPPLPGMDYAVLRAD